MRSPRWLAKGPGRGLQGKEGPGGPGVGLGEGPVALRAAPAPEGELRPGRGGRRDRQGDQQR